MSVRSRILSGVSLISMLAAAGAVGPATAADTLSGPAVFAPYTNAETDTVTINLDATVDADENNDSFINFKAKVDTWAGISEGVYYNEIRGRI